MSKQDLKALSTKAVDRAVAARGAASVELTSAQAESVSGGAAASAYLRDPTWYGIWEILKVAHLPEVVQPRVAIGPDVKIEAGIAGGKISY